MYIVYTRFGRVESGRTTAAAWPLNNPTTHDPVLQARRNIEVHEDVARPAFGMNSQQPAGAGGGASKAVSRLDYSSLQQPALPK